MTFKIYVIHSESIFWETEYLLIYYLEKLCLHMCPTNIWDHRKLFQLMDTIYFWEWNVVFHLLLMNPGKHVYKKTNLLLSADTKNIFIFASIKMKGKNMFSAHSYLGYPEKYLLSRKVIPETCKIFLFIFEVWKVWQLCKLNFYNMAILE